MHRDAHCVKGPSIFYLLNEEVTFIHVSTSLNANFMGNYPLNSLIDLFSFLYSWQVEYQHPIYIEYMEELLF